MICKGNARSLWQSRHSFLNIRSPCLGHPPSQCQFSAMLKKDCCPLQCIWSTDSIRLFFNTFIIQLYPGGKMLDDLLAFTRSPIHMELPIWDHRVCFLCQQPCFHCWLTSISQRKKRLSQNDLLFPDPLVTHEAWFEWKEAQKQLTCCVSCSCGLCLSQGYEECSVARWS